MASLRFKLAVLGGAVLGAVLVGSFGPLVRSRAATAAERLGAEVEVDSVVPTLFGARLRGVHLRVADIPSARVELAEVAVSYGLKGRSIRASGVLVSAVGPRDEVLRQVDAWRTKRSSTEGSGKDTKSAGELDVQGLSFSWKDAEQAPHEAISANDVRVDRSAEGVAVEAGDSTVQLGFGAVHVRGARIALTKAGGKYQLASVGADAVDATVELAPAAPEKEAPADTVAGAARASKDMRGEGASRRAGRVREEVLRFVALADASLNPGLEVALKGVRVRVTRGQDTLGLGPGKLTLSRADGRLQLELLPEAVREGQPSDQSLTFRASAPLQDPNGDIVLDVRGGPIGLATLGVGEGDFGLFDVGRASLSTRSHVVLGADRALTIDGEGKVHGLSLRSAALSDEPIIGLDLAWRAKAVAALDGSKIDVQDGEVDVGAIQVSGAATIERDREHDAVKVHGHVDLPLTGCQAMLDAVPKGLLAKVEGMRLAGSFGLKGHADFDTAHLDARYVLDWETTNSCRVLEAPATVSIERFTKPFKYTVYTPEGRPTDLEAGPGTPSWVPFSSISKFLPVALQTTEDAGFSRHHGFDHEAIKNSIRENIRRRKFVRGASTLSMQLAKNVYLDRTKSLARKLQEAVLTMYLEQELTKEQILELYLNVVEFGPMVYGIGPAARHYFNASPSELSLGQALYLSTLLPNPKAQHFGAGGAATPGWTAYLRKLMKNAHKRRWITDEELEEGLRETVVRGSPAPLRGPPGTTDGADDGIDPEMLAP